MTGALRGIGRGTAVIAALGSAAFGFAYWPFADGVGQVSTEYLRNRIQLPVILGLIVVALASVIVRIAIRNRPRPRARTSDRSIISPVAVVDAKLARAVREILQELSADLQEISSAPAPDIVSFVDRMLGAAIAVGASDVHLHPVESGTQVSFRVHGVLETILNFPRQHHQQLISRLKVLSRLITYQSDRPQDGHFVLDSENGTADIRVSLLPTNHGEKAVLRIARVGLSLPTLDELGCPPELLKRFQSVLSTQQGLLFLTGPTGSGKTTTIYASLGHIKRERGETTQIATIEDPIEFNVPFLTQTQVNTQVDLTFAKGLRSILRQDPNVIMVGEIRDAETAHIAVQAGLTGHQIVTTVHADSAAGAFNRLIEMGVEPFLLASASLASMSQRLVRAICPHCREKTVPLAEEQSRLVELGAAEGQYFRGRGCDKCEQTGYLGRIGLFELLTVTPEIRELMNQKVPTGRIHQQALVEGMQPIVHCGLERARAGQTTLREVFRVCV